MRRRLLTALSSLLAASSLAAAESPPELVPAPKAVVEAAADPAVAEASRDPAIVDNADGPGPVVMMPMDSRPWNPPLKESNQWPYGKLPPCWVDVVPGYVGEFSARAEYWQGAIKDTRLPAMPLTGLFGSTIVPADSGVDYGPFSGGRFTGGVWSNFCNTAGFEGSYFYLAERTAEFGTNPVAGAGSLSLSPPLPAVGVVLDATASFQGADASAVVQVFHSPCWRVEVQAGFRWLDLAEEWLLNSNLLTPTGGVIPLGQFGIGSEFSTLNRFYGGQIGARAEYHHGRILGTLTGKLGFGGDSQEVTLHSGQLVTLPFQDGTYHHTAFSIVPEVGVHIGYQVTTNFRVYAGYDLLFWSNVIRPGNLIDPVPPSSVPALPNFSARQTDFWVQVATVGLEFRY